MDQEEAQASEAVVAEHATTETAAPSITSADVALAAEKARGDAYKEALDSFGRQPARQESPIGTASTIPENPLDMLNAEQRKAFGAMSIAEPEQAAAFLGNLASRHARLKLQEEAAPLVASQASLLVANFKSQQAFHMERETYAAVSSKFDALLRGLDLRPLVAMPESQRDNELMLRWKSALADVLSSRPAQRKAEPALLGGAPGRAGGPKDTATIESHPDLAAMAKAFNFTDEQLKEIGALL